MRKPQKGVGALNSSWHGNPLFNRMRSDIRITSGDKLMFFNCFPHDARCRRAARGLKITVKLFN